MKRVLFYIFAAAFSLVLTACSTTKASVTFDDKMRITGIANVDSEDLVELLKYKDYTAAKAAEKEAPIVHIKAKEGQEVTGLESVTVWNPNKKPSVAAPVEKTPAWMHIWDRTLQTGEKIAKWGLGFKLLDGQQKTERERIKADSEDSRYQTDAWADRLKDEQQKPDVIFGTPYVPPVAEPTPAVTP